MTKEIKIVGDLKWLRVGYKIIAKPGWSEILLLSIQNDTDAVSLHVKASSHSIKLCQFWHNSVAALMRV